MATRQPDRQPTPGRPALLRQAVLVLVALAICVSGSVVSLLPAHACSCARRNLAEALDRSDVVFFGRVQRSDAVSRPRPAHVELVLEVDRVYKGSAYREQVVISPPTGGACGIDPEPGTRVVIFATQPSRTDGSLGPADLITDSCNANLTTVSVPAALGRGYDPFAGSSDEVDRALRVDQSLTTALTIAGVALVSVTTLGAGGLALVWRRRSPR